MDNPDSEMVFYLMLRAVDRFYQLHSRYPGTAKSIPPNAAIQKQRVSPIFYHIAITLFFRSV